MTFLNAPLAEVAPVPAQPSGFGLYSAATVLDAVEVKLRQGVRFLDTVAGGAGSYATSGQASFALAAALASDGDPAWVEAPAFGVFAGLATKPEGLGLTELQDLARTRLALQESSAAETAYWTGKDAQGTATGAPALATAGATALTAAAVSMATGLGLLEEWIGKATGALGVIHAPRHLLGTLTSLHVHRDNGKLRTLTDTPVALGTGYTGVGPAGTRPAGTTWLYATGPVQVLRAPVQDWPVNPEDAFARPTSVTAIHAGRLLSIGHTVGVAAAQITLA